MPAKPASCALRGDFGGELAAEVLEALAVVLVELEGGCGEAVGAGVLGRDGLAGDGARTGGAMVAFGHFLTPEPEDLRRRGAGR